MNNAQPREEEKSLTFEIVVIIWGLKFKIGKIVWERQGLKYVHYLNNIPLQFTIRSTERTLKTLHPAI